MRPFVTGIVHSRQPDQSDGGGSLTPPLTCAAFQHSILAKPGGLLARSQVLADRFAVCVFDSLRAAMADSEPACASRAAGAHSGAVDRSHAGCHSRADGGVREVLESIVVPPIPHEPFTATLITEWVRYTPDGARSP